MKNTNTVKKTKKTGNTRPAQKQTSFAFANHTDTSTTKKSLIDMMIDFDEMLSKRSIAERNARKKLAADFARFKNEVNMRLAALEAVA